MNEEKQNPPDGMAMACLFRGRPFVWTIGGKTGFLSYWSAEGTWIDPPDGRASAPTPIHPLDPADPQPWAIAPERDREGFDGEWRSWVVTREGGHHDSKCPANSDLLKVRNTAAIYRRHTIHGVDLLERVYLREGDEETFGRDLALNSPAPALKHGNGSARPPTVSITPPKVSDVDWNPDPWVRPPGWVQVPEVDHSGVSLPGGDGFLVFRGLYDLTGHLIGYRGPDGGWVECGEKPGKLGRWESDGHVADLDARTMKTPWGETYRLNRGWNEEYLRMVLAGETQWARIPDDEPCCPCCGGDPCVCVSCPHVTGICPECSNRGVTGMGPCSLCTPAPKREPPPAILRKCPQTGNLSLRLEVLSPEREVAEEQCSEACEATVHMQPGSPLYNSLLDLWLAVLRHYPRTRHIPAIEAAFTEYVKDQEDVPKKPEGETTEKQEEK